MSGPAPGTQSIDRAGEMLARLLESDEPMSLRDLAEAADLPKSTASRLLTALERHGLVHQAGERGKLEPGPAILRFAHRGGLERHLAPHAGEVLVGQRELTLLARIDELREVPGDDDPPGPPIGGIVFAQRRQPVLAPPGPLVRPP